MTPSDEARALEALRNAPYPDPAAADRGEVLLATGVGLGLVGVGVIAASAICPPCMLGVVPLSAISAVAFIAAGSFKRWRRRHRPSATVP